MSLNFGASNSYVEFSVGNVANLGNGAFTLIVLWKFSNNSGLLGGYSSTTERQSMLVDTGHLFGTGDFSSGFGTLTATHWYWLGLSKAAGANHYRGHIQDFTSAGAWSHGEAAGAGNHSDPGISDRIRLGAAGTTAVSGDVAVAGIWTSQLADASVEAACTSAVRDLVSASPGWAVKAEQASPDNLQDLVGSGHESTRTGTITASADPPGFDFSLVATIHGTAAGAFGALSGAAAGVRTAIGTAAGAFGALSAFAFASGNTGAAPRLVSTAGAGRIMSRTPGVRL